MYHLNKRIFTKLGYIAIFVAKKTQNSFINTILPIF